MAKDCLHLPAAVRVRETLALAHHRTILTYFAIVPLPPLVITSMKARIPKTTDIRRASRVGVFGAEL